MTQNAQLLTDADVLSSINNRIALLSEMIVGVCESKFHGLTIQGEKGLGKSHNVHRILDTYDPSIPGNEDMPEDRKRSIKRFTGKITPLQLFLALQEYSGKKCILLFDDCDSAWNDIGALNILKAAMDTKPRRVVTWATTARVVREQSFEFQGSIIVITNAHMTSEHYKAFLDRVHKFRLTMTPREKIVKIREIASVSEEYDPVYAEQVVDHIEQNMDFIGPRLSMRTFVKAYDLAAFSTRWRELARETVYAEEQ
jgi:hypothetical protein